MRSIRCIPRHRGTFQVSCGFQTAKPLLRQAPDWKGSTDWLWGAFRKWWRSKKQSRNVKIHITYIYNYIYNIYKRVVQWQPRFRTRFAGTSILWSQANRSRFDDQYKILNDAHGFHSTHLPKVSKAGVTPAKCRGDLVVCLVARCVECRNVCFQNNI